MTQPDPYEYHETFIDRHPMALPALAGIIVFVIFVGAFVLSALFPYTSPWTDLGGNLKRRCDGTTAIYQSPGGLGADAIDAVPNDPACAPSKETR